MVKRAKGTSRNFYLRKSLLRYTRSQMYRRTGKWATKKHFKVAPKPVVEHKKPVITTTTKDGKTHTKAKINFPTQRNARPITDRRARLRRNFTPKTAVLRKSIKPGQVLILLAGRFRGRRVIFVKQLPSGLLLVTGPFKINGVPLRRVNQAFVIATSTRVSLKGIQVDDKVINDAAFMRSHSKARSKSERLFFKNEPQKKKTKLDWEIKKHEVTAPRKQAQKLVDTPLIAEIKKTPFLKAYLGSRFALKNTTYPHLLKF